MITHNRKWRIPLGAFVGAIGGISLTTSIFPFAVTKIFTYITFEALLGVLSFTVPMALLWAIGGGLVGYRGGARAGGLIFGLCGLLAGLILALFAAGGDLPLVAVGGVTGVLYGIPGGLIMGRVFPPLSPT
ncbi:MAG: hypothetical protein ACE5H9_09635 [Anaerolineae bacterium]